MPKEFLLNLNQLLQKLRQSLRNNIVRFFLPTSNPKLNETNLINRTKRSAFDVQNLDYYTFRKLGITVVLVLQAVFLVLLLIDFGLYRSIKTDQDAIKTKVTQIHEKSSVETAIRTISDKIAFYKGFKDQKVFFAPNLDFLLNSIPQENIIDKFLLQKNKFQLTVKTSQAVSFTLLINEYLQNPKVEEIILTSASYNASEQSYTLTMEAILK